MPFMVMNQLNHQESGIANFLQFTSNPGTLLTKQLLCFWISWGGLIGMPLIMVMLRFTLQFIYWNLPLTMFRIQILFQSIKLMIMKCTNFQNSYTQSMMMIFWMLTSICFRIDQWLLLPKYFIHYLLFFHKYGGTDFGFTNFMSHFLMFVPTKANVKFSSRNMGHDQEIGIILCSFLNFPIIYPVGIV